jgi:hypothetical protein
VPLPDPVEHAEVQLAAAVKLAAGGVELPSYLSFFHGDLIELLPDSFFGATLFRRRDRGADPYALQAVFQPEFELMAQRAQSMGLGLGPSLSYLSYAR